MSATGDGCLREQEALSERRHGLPRAGARRAYLDPYAVAEGDIKEGVEESMQVLGGPAGAQPGSRGRAVQAAV